MRHLSTGAAPDVPDVLELAEAVYHPGHVLDAVNEIRDEDVLVGSVSARLGIAHTHAGGWNTELRAQEVLRSGLGHVRKHDWIGLIQLVCCFDDDTDYRRVRVGSGGAFALALYFDDLHVGEALLRKVAPKEAHDLVRFLIRNEPKVDLGGGLRRQHSFATRTLVAACQAADSAGWIKQVMAARRAAVPTETEAADPEERPVLLDIEGLSISKVEQARIDRILTENDPFKPA